MLPCSVKLFQKYCCNLKTSLFHWCVEHWISLWGLSSIIQFILTRDWAYSPRLTHSRRYCYYYYYYCECCYYVSRNTFPITTTRTYVHTSRVSDRFQHWRTGCSHMADSPLKPEVASFDILKTLFYLILSKLLWHDNETTIIYVLMISWCMIKRGTIR